jgi:hypothetical protein
VPELGGLHDVLDIDGRSGMSRDDLAAAVPGAGRQ